MAFNGSGAFAFAANTVQPAVSGTVISQTDFNTSMDEIETALSTCICKDGQTTTTARIPFTSGISLGGVSVDALTGSFTAACTGPMASTNTTISYFKIGKIVCLQLTTVSTAGNSVSAAITVNLGSMPAGIRPATGLAISVPIVKDAGADQNFPGVLSLPTSGNASIFLNGANSLFTATAAAVGFTAFSVTYFSS